MHNHENHAAPAEVIDLAPVTGTSEQSVSDGGVS